MHAAHRKNKRGNVIVKFTNRKFAEAAMLNRDKIREIDAFKNIYINQSLCPEFSYISYALRQAKKKKNISQIKFKHGVPLAKIDATSDYVEISHESDFSKYGIEIAPRSH